MGLIRKLTALAAAALLALAPLPEIRVSAAESVVFTGLSGLPFENGDPFKGVDVSSVISVENSGVQFRDRSGNPQDIFETLADAGINTVRVRIWNDPYSASGENYGGGICDVDTAEKIASRCAKAGLKLLADFHYSDFWADPGKQKAPKAWENYSVDQKAAAIKSFTADTLARLKKTGADIAMVQVGNETTTGMCGVMLADYDWSDAGWSDLCKLYSAGAAAVREFDPNTLVVLHFTNPEKYDNMLYLAKMLDKNRVDYDVFATSYYPYWHGTLKNLTDVLTTVSQTYRKKVMAAETSWVRTFDDSDGFGNTIGSRDKMGSYVSYDVSVSGQAAYLHDVFAAVAAVPDGAGIGVFYWEPAWLPVGSNYDDNLPKWEKNGSGWANRAAGEYDSSAKQYYGGSCVENESLFDSDGKPLDSLYVFGTVHGNNTDTPKTDTDELLSNPGFEADGGWSDHPKGWTLQGSAGDHFDVRAEDARSGNYALHWYSETPFSGCTASASVSAPEDGTYAFTLWIQGDENTKYTVSASCTDTSKQVGGRCSGWAQWQQISTELSAKAGETLTLSVTVSGGSGSFGSVDDCSVTLVKFPPEPPPQKQIENQDISLHLHDTWQITGLRDGMQISADNPAIASVSENGLITANGVGETTVTAVSADGLYTIEISVIVAQPLGDLNADNICDAADIDLLCAYLLTRSGLTPEQAALADLNADGILNAADLSALKALVIA